MSPHELLDYAIGGLDADDPRREQIEREIATDPVLAARAARLRRRLDDLLGDGEEIEPPPGLARRTLALADQYRTRRRSILDFLPAAVPFRWADVAVAAGIFLAALVTLVPAVNRAKLQTDQAACAFNLRQLGMALSSYSSTHGTLPYPAPDCPIPYAGLFKVMLHDGGHLRDPSALDCPCNGPLHRTVALPDFKTLCALHEKDPSQCKRLLGGDYAYHLGVKKPSGELAPVPADTVLPVLADRPDYDSRGSILVGNSPNHAGLGQNVLYTDGHVEWHPTRWLGPHDHDLFLNEEDKPEPGITPLDAVLAPGLFPVFDGR
jgi:prepilin-type processing-associated H-X9-DG protein